MKNIAALNELKLTEAENDRMNRSRCDLYIRESNTREREKKERKKEKKGLPRRVKGEIKMLNFGWFFFLFDPIFSQTSSKQIGMKSSLGEASTRLVGGGRMREGERDLSDEASSLKRRGIGTVGGMGGC